jgi:hypothetical protein
MSIHKSYFSKNNTIQLSSFTNTGLAPYTELYFGSAYDVISSPGFSRFIFNIDLTDLKSKINSGIISTGCTSLSGMTHKLKMINTSSFDPELINTEMSNGRLRATSFDLNLIRIPLTSGNTGSPQTWDGGVGSDYYNANKTINSYNSLLTPIAIPDDRSFSQRPSNWYQRTTLSGWSQFGIYSNTNSGLVNFSGLTIVGTQHFDLGNEDLEIDMTNEINYILSSGTQNVTGWILSYPTELENLSGMTQNYSVAFFAKDTQTFYQPYLETTYNDYINDNRSDFTEKKENKLYLFSYINGELTNLDSNPSFSLFNSSNQFIEFTPGVVDLPTCLVTKGVYEVTIPGITGSTPCTCYDVWSQLYYNGELLPDEIGTVIIKPYKSYFNITNKSNEPSLFGFDFYGIKQNEKIVNTDIRKVGVVIKKAYSTQEILDNVQAFYRVYVKEGSTEVEVQEWTKINRTVNEYYFIFDTTDKIPNEYFIDIKVYTSGQVDTYKRTLQFQIVNQK